MSDYTKTTNFTAKDALSTGDPLKLIKGTYFDTEFDAIATAVATKYDSNDIASEAQAQVGTDNTVLMTPLRTENWGTTWAAENGGMIANIHALTDPGADTILGWDESANDVIGFTIGAGLSHAGTEINLADAVAGAGLTVGSSILAVGAGSGITVNANDVALTAAAASTTNPIVIASGAFSLDLQSLTTLTTATGLAATDRVYIDDAGVSKAVAIQDLGMRVQLAQATQDVAAGDMNSIMEFTATATLTLPLNATTALPVGVPIVLNVKHATQVLTVTAAASVTLVSVFHPAGAAAASDTVRAGGTAILFKTAADVWCLSGDTST